MLCEIVFLLGTTIIGLVMLWLVVSNHLYYRDDTPEVSLCQSCAENRLQGICDLVLLIGGTCLSGQAQAGV